MGQESRRDGFGKGAICRRVLYRSEQEPSPASCSAHPYPQTGVGADPDPAEALKWYRKAAEEGDKRAQKRLQSNNRTGMSALDRRLEMEAMKEDHGLNKGKGDGCLIM